LLLVGASLAAWSGITCGRLNVLGIVFFLVYPWTIDSMGRLVTPWLRVEPVLERSFAFRFLAGFLVLTLAQFLVHTLAPGTPATQFPIVAGLVVLGQVLQRMVKVKGVEPDRGSQAQAQAQAQTQTQAGAELVLVVLCLLAATCWSRGLLVSEEVVGHEVLFRRWVDFFEHASIVSRFLAGESLWSMGNYALSGLSAPVYHYAGYLPAATAAGFTGSTALDAAVSTWNPLGNVLIGLAAYTLVLPWAGGRGGLCAAIAVLLIPDASYYWPANAVLRYHWLQQVGCAGPYGVATAALSVVLLLQWNRNRRWDTLLAAGGCGLATFWFKAQVFLVLVPLLIGLTILLWPGVSRLRRGTLFASTAVLGLVLAWLLIDFKVLPDFGPSRAYLEEYNHTLALDFPEGVCKQVVASSCQELGAPSYYAGSIAIYAVASFGIWLPLGALLLIGAGWMRRIKPYDALPCLVVLLYLFLYACLNDYALVGHNKWELIHRPIVWAYFVVASWCAARLSLALAAGRWTARLVHPLTIAVAAVLLLPLPWRMGRCIQEGKSFWRVSCVNLAYPRGLVESARWINQAGPPSDIVQDGRCDESFLVGGLSERRAYLARPTTFLRDKSAKIRAEVGVRTEQLQRLKSFTTRGQLGDFARQTGIRWYLLHPGDTVGWPADVLANPAFADGGFRVYDLTAVSGRFS
jgi:hypothetical protein